VARADLNNTTEKAVTDRRRRCAGVPTCKRPRLSFPRQLWRYRQSWPCLRQASHCTTLKPRSRARSGAFFSAYAKLSEAGTA
jgi:hypothetical protein